MAVRQDGAATQHAGPVICTHFLDNRDVLSNQTTHTLDSYPADSTDTCRHAQGCQKDTGPQECTRHTAPVPEGARLANASPL